MKRMDKQSLKKNKKIKRNMSNAPEKNITILTELKACSSEPIR